MPSAPLREQRDMVSASVAYRYIVNILSLWLICAHTHKKIHHNENYTTPENNNSYCDIMTGSNFSNDTYAYVVSKCGNKLQWIFFVQRNFGNEIVNHVDWKRHCAIIKKMSLSSGIFQCKNNMRFTMVYWTIICVILHLFIICYVWLRNFPFLKTFRHNGSAIFGEVCLSWMPGCQQILRQHQHFMYKHSTGAGDKRWCPYAH